MTFRLETERLALRPLSLQDIEALHQVLGDAETMSYYPHPFSLEETEAWIRWNLESYRENGHGLWGMELKETGELIGDCGLTVQEVDGDKFVEVGWHVRREHWARGYATEAGSACRDHAFGEIGVDRLVSLVRPENAASCRVAEKLGLTVWKETVRGPGWLHRVYSLTPELYRDLSGSRSA